MSLASQRLHSVKRRDAYNVTAKFPDITFGSVVFLRFCFPYSILVASSLPG
jgi:hypothetical protein